MALNQNTTQHSVIARSEGTTQSRLPRSVPVAHNNEAPVLPLVGTTTEKDTSNRWAPLLNHANELGKTYISETKINKQRQWTPEKRVAQSQIINDNKPWERATGAKTPAGKRNSSQNALKHGLYSAACKKLRAAIRAQEAYRRAIHADAWESIRILHEIRATKRLMAQPTLIQITHDIHAHLTQGGLNISKSEVKMMVKQVTGLSETDYITTPEAEITPEQASALYDMVERRAAGEPLTRIIGEREFWGLNFKVTPDVLDPRQDTETLVEAVLAFLKRPQAGKPATADKTTSRACGRGDKQIKILDLGTGTGCIPIALLTELPNANAYAVEYSHAAAKIARENARLNGVSDRFHIIQGDWMGALKPQSFDIITSNPPYIKESDIENLDDEVKNHDPIMALSGGKDGLDDYKKIISQLKTHLKKDGAAFLEIGFGQLDDLMRLSEESRLTLCDSTADIAGIPRVVEIRAKS